jgi:hypothetical protein
MFSRESADTRRSVVCRKCLDGKLRVLYYQWGGTTFVFIVPSLAYAGVFGDSYLGGMSATEAIDVAELVR